MDERLVAAAIASALLVSACDRTQQQSVVVEIGAPQAPASVRLYSRALCDGSYVEQRLSASRRASFTRNVEVGGIAVITDELSVCVPAGERWKPLFSSVHGPAPRSISIQCESVTEPGQCRVQFDGRTIDEVAVGDDEG